MAKRYELQDGTGVVMHRAPEGNMYVIGTTTPTNGQPSFGYGCVWVNLNGGNAAAQTTYYVNTGSKTSSTWTALT